jgi:hypothetical protein
MDHKPSEPNFVQIIFKNSARTSKRKPHFTITRIKWLTLFKEMVAVYSKNRIKHINKHTALQIFKAAGRYIY